MVFLCIMVSMILLRTVSRDVSVLLFRSLLGLIVHASGLQISRYNSLDLGVSETSLAVAPV